MATLSSLQDLQFAELYLQHVSRQSSPETRARAKILLATIEMLDLKHPSWRTELIEELERRHIKRDIETVFPLPEIDDGKMFDDFMQSLLGEK